MDWMRVSQSEEVSSVDVSLPVKGAWCVTFVSGFPSKAETDQVK